MSASSIPQKSALLETLKGIRTTRTPIWFMRQAGRYLPEYRKLRAQAGSFLDLCYNPEMAAEVTLQPLRRYDLDAAILFADILLIPDALGQDLSFVEGEGPRLSPIVALEHLERFRAMDMTPTLSPVYETIAHVRKGLASDKALIGFAGAPWTVATYMLAGGPQKDPAALRSHWYGQREFVDQLIDILVEKTVSYLLAQIKAGAQAVQLFDTWASGLPVDVLRAVSLEPLAKIAQAVKTVHPDVPVILFPKGVGSMAGEYAKLEACDGIGIDFATPWDWALENLSPHAVVQGGLDPLLVVHGGEAMEKSARALRQTFRDVPYVFNLGHGFTPQTPPENVARLIEIAREGD